MTTTQQTDIDEILALVQRFTRRFTHDPHDQDDLAQITLIKAWLGWKPIMQEWSDAQLKSWLYRVMQRAWIDTTRKIASRPPTEALTDCHYASSNVETGIEAREIIDTALSQLPEKQRVLLLLDAWGYTYNEIAERAHTTRGSVGSGLSRARAALREQGKVIAA